MSTFKGRTDVAQIARSDKAIREWFARAVPVPVSFHKELDPPEAAGQYLSEPVDEIRTLQPDDPLLDGLTFLGVLAHEAVHATKKADRLDRNNPTRFLSMIIGDLVPKEETTADLAAALLAKKLNFDAGALLRKRAALNMAGAPVEYKATILRDAKAAVRWLCDRAESVDSRPFDDDLKRWARDA